MPKTLSTFLDEIASVAGELSRVTRSINPNAFEVTARLEHLDQTAFLSQGNSIN